MQLCTMSWGLERRRVGGAGVRRLHGLERLGQAVEERSGVVG